MQCTPQPLLSAFHTGSQENTRKGRGDENRMREEKKWRKEGKGKWERGEKEKWKGSRRRGSVHCYPCGGKYLLFCLSG